MIRTVVPLAVSVLLGWAARVGLDLPAAPVAEIVTVLIGAGYYAISRALERDHPEIGRWLLAAGLTRKKPVYTRELGTRRS